ncbi:MAG: type II toxin-antitoxin system ParD family antitoxin [Pyrinomonadaceae bacterium]|nr:type II toxin-antitoxin system ParD family antitoxin [Pyrinomonadaceae bacterium]
MATMNISLPDNLKSFIDTRVSTGGYGNVSEYVRELVRQDQKRKEQEEMERTYLEKLREDVQIGLKALQAGKSSEYSSAEDLISDIIKEGKKRLAKR